MTSGMLTSKLVVTYLQGANKRGKIGKRATSLAKETVRKTLAVPLKWKLV